MSILTPNWPQLGPKLAPCWRPKSIKNRSWRPGPFPWNLQDRSKSDFLDFGSIFDRFWIDFCSIWDGFCIAFWLFSLSCDSFFCKLRRGAGGRGEALRLIYERGLKRNSQMLRVNDNLKICDQQAARFQRSAEPPLGGPESTLVFR